MESLNFLSSEQVRSLAAEHGTPIYVYDEAGLIRSAKQATGFPAAFGLTSRYAMKACPTAEILRIFEKAGMHFDASSGFEAERAMLAGIAPNKLLLSSQEYPRELEKLIRQGVGFNACSLNQLEKFGRSFAGGELGLRLNPGLGSGGTNRTNVGGPASSFGIWHEQIEQALELVTQYRLKVIRIHTHIGSGTSPDVWQQVAELSIEELKLFPDATILNLGGGFKVARMSDEKQIDLAKVGGALKKVFEDFATFSGREIHLEIEPGTFMVANNGCIISTIQDIVSTGADGYTFYKIDSGMTDILRPSLYGAQHPLVVVPVEERNADSADAIVVGHCCESGDILTPIPADPEGLKPRPMVRAQIEDLLVVEGAGAYCSGMSAKNYNSFPESAEVLLCADGSSKLIRRRQTLDQIVLNEL